MCDENDFSTKINNYLDFFFLLGYKTFSKDKTSISFELKNISDQVEILFYVFL